MFEGNMFETIQIILSIITGILIPICGKLYSNLRQLERDLAALKVEVAKDYVSTVSFETFRQEYREDMNTNLDDIELPVRPVEDEEESDYDDTDEFEDDLDSMDDDDFDAEFESEFENEVLKGDEA